MNVKTQLGNGGSFDVSVGGSTNKPNGTPGSAPTGSNIPSAPSFGGSTGVPTQKQDADKVPNIIKKSGGNHGGTISPSPTPSGRGIPGVPNKTTIPNK